MLFLWLGRQTSVSAFYYPEAELWLNRDPIEEVGRVSLMTFTGNDLISVVDDPGVRLAKERGAKAINKGLASLQEDRGDDDVREAGSTFGLASKCVKIAGSESTILLTRFRSVFSEAEQSIGCRALGDRFIF